MGHQKTTIQTDDMTIELSLFEEQAVGLDKPYKNIVVKAVLQLDTGTEHSSRKEVEITDSGFVQSVRSALNPAKDANALVTEACREVITDAEETAGVALQITPQEVLNQFRKQTVQSVNSTSRQSA